MLLDEHDTVIDSSPRYESFVLTISVDEDDTVIYSLRCQSCVLTMSVDEDDCHL